MGSQRVLLKEKPKDGDLLSGEVGDVDESVVERSKDVANTKDIFSFCHLGSKADHLFLLLFLAFTGSHGLERKQDRVRVWVRTMVWRQ